MYALGWGVVGPALAAVGLVAFPALLRFSLRRDHRRLRNGVLLLAALVSGAAALAYLAHLAVAVCRLTPTPSGPTAPALPAGIGLVAVVALVCPMPVLLMLNGVVLAWRDGRRRVNLLAFLASLVLLAAPVAAVATGMPTATLVLYACACPGVFLLVLLAQAVVQRVWGGRRAVPHPDVVVVHGAGLVRGRIGPLLGSRIGAGMAAWRDEEALRPGVPLLVMSGGRGADEPMSEARAMADYAVAHGMPEDRVLVEDRSTTTRTNIARSRELLEARGMYRARVLLVTSSFHVVRTAVLAADMGTDWAVAPAACSWRAVVKGWPREYAALLLYRRRVVLVCAALTAVAVLLHALLGA